jgi:F0F1-type ATP synthase delta subunit
VELKLPNELATKSDVVLAHRELSLFIEAVQESIMRHDNPVRYPSISAVLQALSITNQIDLRDEAQSRRLLAVLEQLKSQAPLLRVSFANEPDREALQKIVAWLRQKIDPRIIIQVGLQPTITAGVIVQTSKRRYDLSLRRYLEERRQELVKALVGRVAS